MIADVAMLAFERVRPATFAVRVRRRDKSFPLTSQDLEREIGAAIQQRTALPVDLADPGLELRVELDVGAAYVHVLELASAGGLPVGTSGRAITLLSGGIDSPVASLLAMKRGLAVDFVHFSGEPYLEPTATAKAQAQAKVLNGFQAARPGVAVGGAVRQPAAHALGGLARSRTGSCSTGARWRASAARSPRRLGAAALVTGDSLGQVSSQTLPNMTSVDDASELPMLRPLLTWDKREVMAKAASLGILALSELAADDACPLFAGAKQRTAVPRRDMLAAEAQLDLDALAESAAECARRVEPGVFLDRLVRESRA